jgi:hypothetical protein
LVTTTLPLGVTNPEPPLLKTTFPFGVTYPPEIDVKEGGGVVVFIGV